MLHEGRSQQVATPPPRSDTVWSENRKCWSLSALWALLWLVWVKNLSQQRDVWLAVLLQEAGLIQALLGNGVLLLPLLFLLDLLLRLPLSEVPRLVLHLRTTTQFIRPSVPPSVCLSEGYLSVSQVCLPALRPSASSSSAVPGGSSSPRCSGRSWSPSWPGRPPPAASAAAPSARRPAARSGESTGTCAGTSETHRGAVRSSFSRTLL